MGQLSLSRDTCVADFILFSYRFSKDLFRVAAASSLPPMKYIAAPILHITVQPACFHNQSDAASAGVKKAYRYEMSAAR
jgi:hypothetical protein